MKQYIISLIIVIFFSTCKKENMCDCVKGTGDMVTEIRLLDSFTKIRVAENEINVIITEGANFEVKVEAGKKLISLVKTTVSDNELLIENKNKCGFMRSYKKKITVYVTMPKLSHIFHIGSGTIESTNVLHNDTIDVITKSSGDVKLQVNCYRFVSHLHSTSDIYVRGITDQSINYVTGNGFLYTENLNANYVWVYNKSTGNCYVNVAALLQAIIIYNGDIYYSGNPNTVEQEIIGTGRLIKN